MRWKKILIVILGSIWFFPVSCSISLIAGTYLIAWMDSRDVNHGDQLHYFFMVIFETKNDALPFGYSRLSYLKKLRDAHEIRTFLMSKPSGQIKGGNTIISYCIIENHGTEQIIEVKETDDDGDKTVYSRYRATQTEIFPISSRMWYFGYMLTALPFALGMAIILFVIGLRKK